MSKRGPAMSPIERAEAKIFDLEGVIKAEDGVTAPVEKPVDAPPAEPAKKPDAAPSEAAVVTPTVDEETWEKKYKTLQGMFRGYREQIENLTREVETLKAAPSQANKHDNVLPSGATSEELAAHVAKLNEQYGDEFTEVMRGFVRHETSAMVDQRLDQRLKPVEAKVNQSASDNETMRRENFKRGLTAAVPDWEPIYSSVEFEMWLAESKEAFSGKSYQTLFVDANNRWDLTAMVKFFDAYKQATGMTQASHAEAQKDPRESLVAPGQSNATSHAASPTPQKKIWTLAEVKAFYKDVQTGGYVGREDEQARIDVEIFNADREGRITR